MASSTKTAVIAAAVASGAMIAFQVGGKATRDALFLSRFDLDRLPSMVIASSALSILAVLWAVRRMSVHGPWRFIPGLFAASTALLLVEWGLIGPFPKVTAVLVYLHFTVMGALLISGFWSMVNERFDPRTAKRQIGRIGAAGTVGGVIGGILAERMAAMFTIDLMLPLLAGLHLVATLMVQRLRATRPPRALAPTRQEPPASTADALRLLGSVPYLRNLVLLVLLCTVSEGLFDFVFKGQASAKYGNSGELLRLFAAFYTGVSLLTFLIQTAFARVVLERLGLAGAVRTLPAGVGLTGLGALLFPGLTTALLARGTEAVLHNSLFRSGYELLFTPIQRDEKRATKTMVDVGTVRLGDIIGGGIVQGCLVLGMTQPHSFSVLLGSAVLMAIAALLVARRLQEGYRLTLERNLVAHGSQYESPRSFVTTEHPVGGDTLTYFDLGTLTVPQGLVLSGAISQQDVSAPEARATASSAENTQLDALVLRGIELRSGDRARVRAALAEGPLGPTLVPHVIPLLAWDKVARAAADALRNIAPRITGQLLDALLDPETEFTIRRRIPGILIAAPSERTMDGLLLGLGDRRFEVRYRSGRALADMHQNHPELTVSADRVYAAVLREVTVDRQIWESQRLLDNLEDVSDTPFLDDFLRERAGRSMEHVFTVLSLVIPGEPLRIAFRGLYTEDDHLRGTALEYLETALPQIVRDKLWPFLEDRRKRRPPTRDREEIIADLMRSNESISLSLREIKDRIRDSQEGERSD